MGFTYADAFFVTEQALYIGQSEEIDTGFGLYRYGFDEGEWDLIGFDGYAIFGIVVWGESDENILLRTWDGSGSGTWRSTDSGVSWVQTGNPLSGLPALQSPADTSRMISETSYSTDSGWTWNESNLTWYLYGGRGQAYDPSNGSVAYYTAGLGDETSRIYRTTNGGAIWSQVWLEGFNQMQGIDVEWDKGAHVMTCNDIQSRVLITSDAGQNWTWRPSPFHPREVLSPPWAASCFFVAGSAADETTYEVWWTSDLGDTWTSYSVGLPILPGPYWNNWIRIQAHPTEPILFVALEPTGVWRLDLSAVSAIDGEELDLAETRLAAYPNPSSGSVTIAFQDNSSLPMRSIRVVDVMGRVVNTLDASSEGTPLRWDGRDRQGREVASGVYRIVTLRPDGHVGESERVLILR